MPGEHSATYPYPLDFVESDLLYSPGWLEVQHSPASVSGVFVGMSHHDFIKVSFTKYKNLLKQRPNSLYV